ncbi:unnamed protein product [Spirodela intermedia]|uniref:Uncharacterized protein n=1 Tax=Spirodela intermedia TaxID=51605 RepID=A0A7I8K5L0_SPIIN|nr:unnamed protein product [Spirodela intermedia]
MVLQKRLGYEFNGYQVPNVPRGSRSTRGKRCVRKRVVENDMCAFELLASVAGELLLGKESSPAQSDTITGGSNPMFSKDKVKEEQDDGLNSYEDELRGQKSCDHVSRASKIGFQGQEHGCIFTECLHPSSIVIISDPSEKVTFAEESVFSRNKSEFARSPRPDQGKFSVKVHSPLSPGSYRGKVEDRIPTPPQFERQKNADGIVPSPCFSEDLMEVDIKPPPLVSSSSSIETSPKSGSHMEYAAGIADYEKSSSCNQTCNMTSKPFRPQRIVDRRIRKLLASKFWKVGPTLLKDGDFSDKDEDVKPLFYSRKMCYKRQRTQKFSFKRKKLFQRGSISSCDLPYNGEGLSCSPEIHIKGEASSSETGVHGGNGTSSSPGAQKFAFDSDDYHVKLSIKSFKVPELFIEIPETATIGSLKRTVMEAVTAILGGGLRIGVHLQGKKVRDDSKTLLQAGISHSDELESLRFTLEPNSLQSPKPLISNNEDAPLLPICDSPEPLKRLPPIAVTGGDSSPKRHRPPLAAGDPSRVNSPRRGPTTPPAERQSPPDSKALVPVPAADAEALAVFPLHGKSRRSETGQRRVRRPFSVSEVEALVHAVEKLGTGRWRDVKICAFDSAKHRTYVDLKDKWKTLVHTARISPQRRRGEPVPQELLDRVLSAHAYWSQQQAKAEPCPRLT